MHPNTPSLNLRKEGLARHLLHATRSLTHEGRSQARLRALDS